MSYYIKIEKLFIYRFCPNFRTIFLSKTYIMVYVLISIRLKSNRVYNKVIQCT